MRKKNYRDILNDHGFLWSDLCQLFIKRKGFGQKVMVEKMFANYFVARRNDNDCLGSGRVIFDKEFNSPEEFEEAVAQL